MGIGKSLLGSRMKKIFARVLFLVVAGAYAQSCSLMGGKDKSVGASQEIHASQPQPEVWFKGNVDEAFKIAKKDKKMVFLYWGAVWCPPCNELKQQIFSKPRFAELMTNFVPVYLDGDTEAAQIWGEKFQASGYPTVLILDENQKELFRLSTVLSIEEFDGAVQSVLASSGSLERAASAVMESRAKHKDLLVLAYSSWDQLPEAQWPASRRINLMEQAFESAETSPEKSIFGSQWITQLVNEKTKLSEKLLQRVFAAIFTDNESIWASREFIKYQAGAVAEWTGWKPGDQKYVFLRSEWLKAAAQLESHPSASVSSKLWSVNPEIEFYKYEHPDEALPKNLISKVEIAARHADEEAKSEYDRHSVISDAAYLLRQVGSFDKGRQLLLTELKKTNTPWYYEGALSGLENQAGRPEEAKKWSAAARKSVQGRASKVQWITSDLLLNAKDTKNGVYVAEIARAFYEQTMKLRDGFSGRNWMRAKKVQEALEPFKGEVLFKKIFTDFAPSCEKTQIGESKKNCAEHFAALKS